MSELVEVQRKFRSQIPRQHRTSLDTRIVWLWNQRFGTVQNIWVNTPDILDKTACTMILQAILANDLNNIQLVFRRLEGGAQLDEVIAEEELRI